MTNYKLLVSSAPAHSILNAQTFHYVSSAETDIRKTFAKVRRAQARAAAFLNPAGNVRRLTLPSKAKIAGRASGTGGAPGVIR